MKNPLGNSDKWTWLLREQLKKFISAKDLIPESREVFLGFSGGPDSVFLAYVVHYLRDIGLIKTCCLLTLHHGMRKNDEKVERDWIKSFAKKMNFELVEQSVQESPPKADIENWGRKKRQTFFRKFVQEKKSLWLGHHLDDAYEWYLLQQMQTATPFPKGMPLVNKVIARPLFCVSKAHILKFLELYKISFLYDVSNSNKRFSRNYLRHEIVPKLKQRNPQLLKNFVLRMQAEQRTLPDKNASTNLSLKPIEQFGVEITGTGSPWRVWEATIRENIKKYSSKGRGKLGNQLELISKAWEDSKVSEFHISGNLILFLAPDYIAILRKDYLLEQQGKDTMRTKQGFFKKSHHYFPYWTELAPSSSCKTKSPQIWSSLCGEKQAIEAKWNCRVIPKVLLRP